MFRRSKIRNFSRPRVQLGLAVVAGIWLNGCGALSPDSNSNWGRFFQYAQLAWKGSPPVTLKQAAAIPYASISVQLGDGPQSILVLATSNNGDNLWTSASYISIETLNGRIVRTDGIGRDLGGVIFRAGDPLVTASEAESTRLMDFRDTRQFGVPVQCQMTDRGPAAIEILGQLISTRQKDERCHSDVLNWDFTNSFWVDSDHFVWKSVQYVHPNAAPITIETLRPPG